LGIGANNSANDLALKISFEFGAVAMASLALNAVTAPIKPAILLSILSLLMHSISRLGRSFAHVSWRHEFS
jgi:hypothetical protein